jgi:hypothetical protein
MGDDEQHSSHNIEVGDIVRESSLIIPPDRKSWTGLVVYIDKMVYELHSHLGPFEDLVAIHWFQAGYVESLPASVIRLVQKAKKNS